MGLAPIVTDRQRDRDTDRQTDVDLYYIDIKNYKKIANLISILVCKFSFCLIFIY